MNNSPSPEEPGALTAFVLFGVIVGGSFLLGYVTYLVAGSMGFDSEWIFFISSGVYYALINVYSQARYKNRRR